MIELYRVLLLLVGGVGKLEKTIAKNAVEMLEAAA